MTESLPQLIARRQADLRVRSLRELWRRLPEGEDRITYETLRNLSNGTQRNTRDDRVVRDLALMLGVTKNEVRAAMGNDPSFGPFELPPRAQILDPVERAAVLGVIDAILYAKRGSDVGKSTQKSPDPGLPGRRMDTPSQWGFVPENHRDNP